MATTAQVAIGLILDTLTESVSEGAADLLTDAAGAATKEERVKRYLTTWLSRLSDDQLKTLQSVAKWSSRFTSSALKKGARTIMRRKAVSPETQDLVIDTIDDLVETLGRRTTEALSADEIKNYIGSSVTRAQAAPTTSSTATSGIGAPMTSNPTRPGSRFPELVANLSPRGLRRFMTAEQILADSRNPATDSTDELFEARQADEGLGIAIANHTAEMLEILENSKISNDDAVSAYLAVARRYGTPKIGDTLDAMVTGEARKAMIENRRWAVAFIARWGKVAIYLVVGLVVIVFSSFVGSVYMAVTSGFEILVDTTVDESKALDTMKYLLVACFLAMFLGTVWDMASKGVGKVGAFFRAIFSYFGFNFNQAEEA